jgi:hypothetical protein
VDLDMAIVERGRGIKGKDKALRKETFVFNLGQIISEYNTRTFKKLLNTNQTHIIDTSGVS